MSQKTKKVNVANVILAAVLITMITAVAIVRFGSCDHIVVASEAVEKTTEATTEYTQTVKNHNDGLVKADGWMLVFDKEKFVGTSMMTSDTVDNAYITYAAKDCPGKCGVEIENTEYVDTFKALNQYTAGMSASQPTAIDFMGKRSMMSVAKSETGCDMFIAVNHNGKVVMIHEMMTYADDEAVNEDVSSAIEEMIQTINFN